MIATITISVVFPAKAGKQFKEFLDAGLRRHDNSAFNYETVNNYYNYFYCYGLVYYRRNP